LRDGDLPIIRIARFLKGTALEDTDVVSLAWILNYIQDTVFFILLALVVVYLLHVGPLLKRLAFTSLQGVIIVSELGVLFSLVYGGMAGMGMPGVFWNENPWIELNAAMGVTLFYFWMLYLLFLQDYGRHRHEVASAAHATEHPASGEHALTDAHSTQRGFTASQQATGIWSLLFPPLEKSGLTSLICRDIAKPSATEQLACFLTYAGIPALILLVVPAELPNLRPADESPVVAWHWLGGMSLAVVIVATIVLTRAATRVHVLWQIVRRRSTWNELLSLDPDRLDAHANTKNALIIMIALFLLSLPVPKERFMRYFPPAFSICVVFTVVATFAIWVGTKSWATRWTIAGVMLALLALAGALDYEVRLDDLEAWYPSTAQQLGRRLDPRHARPKDYGSVVSLADYQKEKDERAVGRCPKNEASGVRPAQSLDSKAQRQEILQRWADSLQARGGSSKASKPILVVVTTSGGALRAAIWTEAVLNELNAAIPGFRDQIRLITGASGGMLGAANYVAGVAAAADPSLDQSPSTISSDYLSPIAWQIAFRDSLPNALLPWATHNRGQVLQDSWCVSAPRLAYTFGALKQLEEAGKIPSIIFSPMLVEDGRRLLISNLPLADLTGNDGDTLIKEDEQQLRERLQVLSPQQQFATSYDLEYPGIASVSALEFFDLFGEDARCRLKLASAVRMSATFPCITSAAVLPTDPPRHVVDAGYYDNYGVNLAASWIASHSEWIQNHTAGVLVVQIRAFRNEKRLKILDENIASVPSAGSGSELTRWLKHASDIARIIPETVSLLLEGVQSLVLPVEGVAQARYSSMYFRNDEQIVMLQKLFNTQTNDPNFFRSVIFTCDTVQYGQESQNIETLNWYIDQHESDLIKQNMQPLDAGRQTGRDRNALRLAVLMRWWNARSNALTAQMQETALGPHEAETLATSLP
jgi:hypothetical protein